MYPFIINTGAYYDPAALLVDPMLDNLREDSRFQKLLLEDQEKVKIKQTFHAELEKYHDNDELRWLKPI